MDGVAAEKAAAFGHFTTCSNDVDDWDVDDNERKCLVDTPRREFASVLLMDSASFSGSTSMPAYSGCRV